MRVKLQSHIKFASLLCSLEGLVDAIWIVHASVDRKVPRHLFLCPLSAFRPYVVINRVVAFVARLPVGLQLHTKDKP